MNYNSRNVITKIFVNFSLICVTDKEGDCDEFEEVF